MPVLVFSPSGAVHFMASNNDSGVRDYDMERFQLCKHFHFDWPVNVSSSGYFVTSFLVLETWKTPFSSSFGTNSFDLVPSFLSICLLLLCCW